jgi:hypothetical protein
VGNRRAKNDAPPALEKRSGIAAPKGVRNHPIKLNPAHKSWLDNVIISALVEEYVAEIERKNRLVVTGGSEVRSNMEGEKS